MIAESPKTIIIEEKSATLADTTISVSMDSMRLTTVISAIKRRKLTSGRGGTFKGAGRGAAVGAIIGAISGDAGKGAAIGAGLGAVGGTVRKRESRDKLYQREYRRCMRRNRNR